MKREDNGEKQKGNIELIPLIQFKNMRPALTVSILLGLCLITGCISSVHEKVESERNISLLSDNDKAPQAKKPVYHTTYVLTRDVKKGEVLTREIYAKGLPCLIGFRSGSNKPKYADISSFNQILDDEISKYIGRKFKKDYKINDLVIPFICKDMFDKTVK